MTARCHIALLGIDGAGKSSVASALADSLRSNGDVVEVVSWKQAMRDANPPTRSALSMLSMASHKFQCAAAAISEDPTELTAVLPNGDFSRFQAEPGRKLQSTSIQLNEALPFLSAALLELAGSMFLHQVYIGQKLELGTIVIDESYGFKHVLKNVLLATRLFAEEHPTHIAARTVLKAAEELFGSTLQPTDGYWLDTDARLALRWRQLAGVSPTHFENYGLLEPASDESFVAMQEDCRRAFSRVAHDWGWRRLEMVDRPQPRNIRAAIEVIEKDLTARLGRP